MGACRAGAEAARIHELPTLPQFIRDEWLLAFSTATCLAFLLSGEVLSGGLSSPMRLTSIFLWLFATVLGSSLSVVRHADHLAGLLGEPFGTMILTVSITLIEVVSISAVMMHGDNNPTLARDTLFAVVMIILNGMVGLSLLLGAWRHREQHYRSSGRQCLSRRDPAVGRAEPDPA